MELDTYKWMNYVVCGLHLSKSVLKLWQEGNFWRKVRL